MAHYPPPGEPNRLGHPMQQRHTGPGSMPPQGLQQPPTMQQMHRPPTAGYPAANTQNYGVPPTVHHHANVHSSSPGIPPPPNIHGVSQRLPTHPNMSSNSMSSGVPNSGVPPGPPQSTFTHNYQSTPPGYSPQSSKPTPNSYNNVPGMYPQNQARPGPPPGPMSSPQSAIRPPMTNYPPTAQTFGSTPGNAGYNVSRPHAVGNYSQNSSPGHNPSQPFSANYPLPISGTQSNASPASRVNWPPLQSYPLPPGVGGQSQMGLNQPPSSNYLQNPNLNQPAGAWQQPPMPASSPNYNSWPPLQSSGPGSFVNKNRPIDLTQEKIHILKKEHTLEPLTFPETNQSLVPPKQKNCAPEVFRCTLNGIPNTQGLLNKVKLPLGLIIHPFKDLTSLPVIQAGTIVRCKRCRAYINPFVDFLDVRRWQCNLCFVVNDVTEEFLHHPLTRSYGEPHTRPECTNSTIEFVAPQEYMVRPPQPAVYMFLFDVSHAALETGYLEVVCERLLKHIDHLPGDKRTKIGFITYDGYLHFYRLTEGAAQPAMLVVSDLDDVFLPIPDSLLVNLNENEGLVRQLLEELPGMHAVTNTVIKGEAETKSCLGAALQAASKLMSSYGGRITVFQQTLPNAGPGALTSRENPNARAGAATKASLNPSTDFYKKMALEFSGKQIAADFFFLNAQYIDIATLSCASRFSAGDLHYYPHLHTVHNPVQVERLEADLDRYLSRKIGLESVMRVRCTKGLAINTFHGNFFVRSTDLLALANVNPDAGFGINISIEDDLSSLSSVSIQAALLYTSSKGERRIRVHTMKFPVVKSAIDVFNAVDSDAVVTLLAKMAVDRSLTSSLSDAKDALLNAVVDALKSYKECCGAGQGNSAILVPPCMKSYPLAISFLLKHPAFRSGVSTRLDDRVFALVEFKMQPAGYVLQAVHPNLYRVDNLAEQGSADFEGSVVPQPQQLPLSAESLGRSGVFLLDTGFHFYLYVSPYSSRDFIENVIGVKQFSNIEQPMYALPDLENSMSDDFNTFLGWLRDQRPYHAALQVIRSDSREHHIFMGHLRLDKTESSMSYQEFLQHVQQQLAK